ncbi:uncharacterized protein G2W53_030849 [Senna tora]|uniref:Uncharacterized protein n=1 Tax=Senna tora TaxID=362788 RepID=A0A834T7U5_9FABA|nr:uncharacterized protein G2W53_030849 [Senna tora]
MPFRNNHTRNRIDSSLRRRRWALPVICRQLLNQLLQTRPPEDTALLSRDQQSEDAFDDALEFLYRHRHRHQSKGLEQAWLWGRIVMGEIHYKSWPGDVDFADELTRTSRAANVGGVWVGQPDHAVTLVAPIVLGGPGAELVSIASHQLLTDKGFETQGPPTVFPPTIGKG